MPVDTIIGEDGKTLKSLVTTLNIIFKSIDDKLDGLTASFKELKDEGLIQDVKLARLTAEEALGSFAEHNVAIASIREDIDKIKYSNETIVEDNNKLKERVNHLENYSRRDNLVIRGVSETVGEVCGDLAKQFMKNHLKMDSTFINSVKFVRCHRLGFKPQGAQRAWVRPIIVRFYNFGDRCRVWSARKELANTGYSMSENFSTQTEYNRRKLYPLFRAAKKRCLHVKTMCL